MTPNLTIWNIDKVIKNKKNQWCHELFFRWNCDMKTPKFQQLFFLKWGATDKLYFMAKKQQMLTEMSRCVTFPKIRRVFLKISSALSAARRNCRVIFWINSCVDWEGCKFFHDKYNGKYIVALCHTMLYSKYHSRKTCNFTLIFIFYWVGNHKTVSRVIQYFVASAHISSHKSWLTPMMIVERSISTNDLQWWTIHTGSHAV